MVVATPVVGQKVAMHLPQSLGGVDDDAPRSIFFGGRGCQNRMVSFTSACPGLEVMLV